MRQRFTARIYLWTVPLPLGRLDLLEKYGRMVILSAIFSFLVMGADLFEEQGGFVRASGVALLDTSGEPRD